MPGDYSTSLRGRVLVAVKAGEPADAVADEFMVGRSSVYRWLAAARDEGRRVAKPMGRGPKPIIRDGTGGALCRLLEADNHLTLVECRDRLAAENLFVGSMSQLVRCQLQLPVELSAIPGM